MFLVFLLSAAGLVIQCLLASACMADPYVDPQEEKADWQRRYYALRLEEARWMKTIELATKEYADANRRNYRRSGARHFHRTNADDAKRQLEAHRLRIEAFREDFRRSGGLIYWLDEIDDEPIDTAWVEGFGDYRDDGRFGGKGAYDSESRPPSVSMGPDAGRNPRFHGTESESEDRIEEAEARYDHRSWTTDRSTYEAERGRE